MSTPPAVLVTTGAPRTGGAGAPIAARAGHRARRHPDTGDALRGRPRFSRDAHPLPPARAGIRHDK